MTTLQDPAYHCSQSSVNCAVTQCLWCLGMWEKKLITTSPEPSVQQENISSVTPTTLFVPSLLWTVERPSLSLSPPTEATAKATSALLYTSLQVQHHVVCKKSSDISSRIFNQTIIIINDDDDATTNNDNKTYFNNNLTYFITIINNS